MPRALIRRKVPGRRLRVAQVVLVAAVVAAGSVVVPPAAEAAPVSSTTQLSAFSTDLVGTTIGVRVEAGGSSAPSGVVAVSADGTELFRATLTPIVSGSTSVGEAVTSVRLAPGDHTLTLSYLGSDEVQPSRAEEAVTVPVVVGARPMSGSLRVGSAAVAFPASGTFSGIPDPGFYDPLSGELDTLGNVFALVDVTGEVPGVGAVTVTVRPSFALFTGFVQSSGSVSFWPGAFELEVRTITAQGVTWNGGCTVSGGNLQLRGAVDGSGLALSATGTTPVSPVGPDACDGRGDLVNAVLTGTIGLSLDVDGSFPLPPAPNTPTTTELTLEPVSGLTAPDRVRATARVSVPGHQPRGTVVFRDNGTQVASATLDPDGSAWAGLPLTEGSHTITAEYQGFSVTILTTVTLLLPSTDSRSVAVGPSPGTGRSVSGSVRMGSADATPLPVGSLQIAAPYDPASGGIGSGRIWMPVAPGTVSVFGPMPVQYRLVQTEDATGHVGPDGSVAFTPADFRLELRSYFWNDAWHPVTDCEFEPVELTLTGTADSGGLHLTATDVAVPAVPSTACGGTGTYLSNALAGGLDVAFDVAGDFARPADATDTEVVSWFPTVAQHNQTFLTASVSAASGSPSGVVVFRDGGTVLGASPLDGSGHANLAVALDQAGSRTVTGTYEGDPDHAGSAGSTHVEVVADPVGATTTGSVQLGGVALPVTDARLVPSSSGVGWSLHGLTGLGALPVSSSGGSFLFQPTVADLVVPGYGSVQAEVRLLQPSEFASAAVEADGTIQGLESWYVLQVRRVTTAAGTTTPLGCVDLVGLRLAGRLTGDDATLTSVEGASARWPVGSCTGPGLAVAQALTGSTFAELHATF